MDIQDFKGTLDGKVVLITGAGGGIGLETARCIVTMGAKVIVLDNDREKGERAEAACGPFRARWPTTTTSTWRTKAASQR